MNYFRLFIIGFSLLLLIQGFVAAELKKGDKLIPFSLRSTEDKVITVKVEEERLTLVSESTENGEKVIQKTYPDVVYLDFWAIWCIPCRVAMPYLQKLHEKFKPGEEQEEGGVVLLGISLDRKGLKVVKPFVKKAKINYLIVADSPGNTGDESALRKAQDIAEAYNVVSLPTAYMVDSKGVIQNVHVGFKREYATELEEMFKKLVSGGKE